MHKASIIGNQAQASEKKLYSWHAPAGHFILHAQALHDNSYDGHTLSGVLEEFERWMLEIGSKTRYDKANKKRIKTAQCSGAGNRSFKIRWPFEAELFERYGRRSDERAVLCRGLQLPFIAALVEAFFGFLF